MALSRQVAISAIVLFLTLLIFEATSLDLWLQQWFYSKDAPHWLWSSAEPITKFILYDGIKGLLIIIALCLLAVLLFGRRLPSLQPHLSAIRIVFLSLITVPLMVGALKATTNVACPGDLQQFGGQWPYAKLLESYPVETRPTLQQRCFPAGHASGGFALMVLFFVFKRRRNRVQALLFAVTLGWLMGGYKMIIGDHFLSHTLVTMELSWLLICLIVLLETVIQKSKQKKTALAE